MVRRLGNSILAVVGFVLSPLSWWNDPFVNVPLAYLFSAPFTFVDERLFAPTFVLGYWLTNVAGLALMHRGLAGLAERERRTGEWRKDLAVSLAYTAVIVLLVALGWLKAPVAYLRR